MDPVSFLRWSGLALACGGALTALINVGLTPLLGQGLPMVKTAATPVFLWRQSLSALAIALLLFGSAGLHLSQNRRAGRFGVVAFAMTFLGTAMVLGWEWVDIFILPDLARRAPSTLQMLEDTKGPNPYNLGALIPFCLFALGWLALAVSTYRASRPLRTGAALVVAGLFAVPLLSAASGPIWGGALGNIVLGSGWILLGLGVRREAVPAPKSATGA